MGPCEAGRTPWTPLLHSWVGSFFVHSSIFYLRWDQEFRVGKAPGLHPVEMLARIAKFEVVKVFSPRKKPKYLFRENLSPATSHTPKTFEAEAALARSASRPSKKLIQET